LLTNQSVTTGPNRPWRTLPMITSTRSGSAESGSLLVTGASAVAVMVWSSRSIVAGQGRLIRLVMISVEPQQILRSNPLTT